VLGSVIDAAGGWMPTADEATIVLRSRDVFTGHSPLLGQFSEASSYLPHGQNVFAPGPSLYWLLAIPAQVVGHWPWAPLVWTALVEAGVVIAVVWLAGQLGGRLLAAGTALGLVLMMASIGARNLYFPWSVNIPVLPMVLLVFLTWAILDGSFRLLPVAVVVVSFEVQADPSFGFVSVVLAAVIAAATLRAMWRARPRPAARAGGVGPRASTLALAFVAALLLWLPPLVQQVTTSPGNLTLLARSTRHQGAREGLAFGLSILGKVAVRWPLLEFDRVPLSGPSGAPTTYVAAGALLLVTLVGILVIGVSHQATHLASGIIAALAVSVGLVAGAALLPADSLTASAFWLLAWAPVVGLVTWVIGGWAVWTLASQAVSRRSPAPAFPRAGPWAAAAGIVVIAAAAAANVGYLVARPDPRRRWYPVVRTVTAELARRPHDTPYAVGAVSPGVALVVGQGLLLALETRAVPVGANDGFERSLGRHYRLPHNTSVSRVVITGDVNRFGFTEAPPPRGHLLAQMPIDLREYGKQVVVRVFLVPAQRSAATR
jgi:hypothetical protein